jgi:hypothetical protein
MQGQANIATQLRSVIHGKCYLQQSCCRCCDVRAWRRICRRGRRRRRTDKAGRALLAVAPPPPVLLSVRRSSFPLWQEEREENAGGGRPEAGSRRRGGTTMDVRGRAAVGVCRGGAFMVGFGCFALRSWEELPTTEQLPNFSLNFTMQKEDSLLH